MKLRYLLASLLLGSVIFYSCKKSSSTDPGTSSNPTISALNCATATFSIGCYVGFAYNGTATVSYTGGNGANYPAGTAVQSTGVTGLTATLVAGKLTSGSGTAKYTITGTPSGTGTASFAITLGDKNCTLTLPVQTAPQLDYAGKWAYQYIRDTFWNWNEYIYNDNIQIDSFDEVDYRGSAGYFEFRNNYTFTWQTSNAANPPYNGTFTEAATGFGTGILLKCVGISTSAPPNDTTRFYIYELNPTRMVLNRVIPSLTDNPGDTVVIDRYYELLKQ